MTSLHGCVILHSAMFIFFFFFWFSGKTFAVSCAIFQNICRYFIMLWTFSMHVSNWWESFMNLFPCVLFKVCWALRATIHKQGWGTEPSLQSKPSQNADTVPESQIPLQNTLKTTHTKHATKSLNVLFWIFCKTVLTRLFFPRPGLISAKPCGGKRKKKDL